jgi:hypothetical protein
VTITKSRKVSWNLTGEQIRSLDNANGITPDWVGQLVQQGMRTLRNEAEIDALSGRRHRRLARLRHRGHHAVRLGPHRADQRAEDPAGQRRSLRPTCSSSPTPTPA